LLVKILETETRLIKKVGRKPREFHSAANAFTRFYDKVISRLVRGGKKKTNPRVAQSKNDHINLSTMKFFHYMDIQRFYPSFDLIEYAGRQCWLKKYLILSLFSSKVNGSSPRFISLRGGLSASNAIAEDVTEYLINKASLYNVKCSIFVDDIAIYSDSRTDLERFTSMAEEYLAQFNVRFHSKERKEKNSGIMSLEVDQRLSGRLGLLFYRKEGKVFSKLRPSTKRVFLLKLRRKLKNARTNDQRMRILSKMLHGQFGLYKTWPRSIWTCRIDRKCFEIKISKLAKKHIWTGLSAKELFLATIDKNQTAEFSSHSRSALKGM
jgi:hypothetical protein